MKVFTKDGKYIIEMPDDTQEDVVNYYSKLDVWSMPFIILPVGFKLIPRELPK